MLYAIRGRLGDSSRDNVRLEEALAIIKARKLPHLQQRWLAHTHYSVDEVRGFLKRHAHDDDEIEVGEIRRASIAASPPQSLTG
jgi:hypothetical protein